VHGNQIVPELWFDSLYYNRNQYYLYATEDNDAVALDAVSPSHPHRDQWAVSIQAQLGRDSGSQAAWQLGGQRKGGPDWSNSPFLQAPSRPETSEERSFGTTALGDDNIS
jgi:hypothetical protein